MKADEARLAILKCLSLSLGRHGYDLYQELKDVLDIKNPSELYKVIRSMKEDGLVLVAAIDKQGGREREILELSQAGLEAYYQGLLDSAKSFVDLITETSIRRLGEEMVKRFEEIEAARDVLASAKSILVDLAIPIERQLQLVNQISKYFRQAPVFYLKTTRRRLGTTRETPAKFGPNIHLLDENMGVKPGSIDVAWLLGPIMEGTLGIITSLKPTGTLLAITIKENLRLVTPRIVASIEELFNILFEEPVSGKLVDSLSRLFLSELLYDELVLDIDIRSLLEKHFMTIEQIQLKKEGRVPFFDIFVASGLKQA